MGQLERSQWLSSEAVEALQRRQLEALLEHARATPFYRERLAAAGLGAGAPLTREVWEGIPVLERSEIQARGWRERWAGARQANPRVQRLSEKTQPARR